MPLWRARNRPDAEKLTTTEVRQGIEVKRMRIVLAVSLLLTVIAFVAVWAFNRAPAY